MISSNLRFGAIVPIIGENEHTYKVARAVEKAAKAKGQKTVLSHGPMEVIGFDQKTKTFRTRIGLTVYTGKDADNYLAYQAAEKKAAVAENRHIGKQLKELGPPPEPQDILSPPTYRKLEEQYEKRHLIWQIFNPAPKMPRPSDFNLPREPENYSDFEDASVVEQKLQGGTLDLQG